MTVRLFWNRGDKQGDIPMGEYFSNTEAMLAIPAARAELYENCCADQEERDAIDAGFFSIEECDRGRDEN